MTAASEGRLHISDTGRPRFFIDHGMIHDRVTGKHVDTEPVEYEEGKFDLTPINEACELLNELAALAAGTQSAETSETSAPSEGCQSGGDSRNAQGDAQ
jgi:hypothetical protein